MCCSSDLLNFNALKLPMENEHLQMHGIYFQNLPHNFVKNTQSLNENVKAIKHLSFFVFKEG